MRILGINKGMTLSGKPLRHGGAALYDSGILVALAEERGSGIKYAGGYDTALKRILDSRKLDLSDVDYIAVSTCCESINAATKGHHLATLTNQIAIDHHLSHASLAFYGSGFDRALVVISDGGGNTLSSDDAAAEWWTGQRQQCSYYLGSREAGLELVGRDFEDSYAVGFGELYRAFTYFLGWHSSVHAARTMALAARGSAVQMASKRKVWEMDDGIFKCVIDNDPVNPIAMIHKLGAALKADFGEPRLPGQAILQIHRDLAAFVQFAMERALKDRLKTWRDALQVDKLCLAGGTALNVVCNGAVRGLFSGGTYVPSAPGDEGQALGNVFAALDIVNERGSIPTMTVSSDAQLGPAVTINSAAVAEALRAAALESYVVFETSDFSDLVADLLASGSLVCIYQDRSEYGPRALGGRSILADPRREGIHEELNNIKARDWFMPFAPVALRERAAEAFSSVESPFMSFAVPVKDPDSSLTRSVSNVDGSARLQTIDQARDQVLAGILEKFRLTTGNSFVLNTSFNAGGEPIVETLDQALRTFSKMPVNVLAVGRFVVLKSVSPAVADLPLESSVADLNLVVMREASARAVETSAGSTADAIRQLQFLTNSVVFVRTELPLYGKFLGWLRQGQKVTTIRYRKAAVEIPYSKILPLYKTSDFGPGDRSVPTEHVQVEGIRYQRFGELTSVDARRDGFRDLEDMRTNLRKIYPSLEDEEWVTVYEISIVR